MNVRVFNNELYIRYIIKDKEPWFFGKDIAKALEETKYEEYIDKEDKEEIFYSNNIGGFAKSEKAIVINLYAVNYLISVAMLKNNTDKARLVKDTIYKRLLPITKVNTIEVSGEDLAILKIIHSKTASEIVASVKEYKEVVIKEERERIKTESSKNDSYAPHRITVNLHSIKDVSDALGLRKGAITRWAAKNNLFEYGGRSGKSPVIKEDGKEYFRLYKDGSTVGKLGITDKGFALMERSVDELRGY